MKSYLFPFANKRIIYVRQECLLSVGLHRFDINHYSTVADEKQNRILKLSGAFEICGTELDKRIRMSFRKTFASIPVTGFIKKGGGGTKCILCNYLGNNRVTK